MRHGNLALPLIVFLAATAGGCTRNPTTKPPPPTTVSYTIETPTVTASPSEATPHEPTSTPSIVATDPESVGWPDGELLSLPLDLEFAFPTPLSSLPPGLYLLDEDEPSAITASAIDGSGSEQLVSYSRQLRAWQLMGTSETPVLLAEVGEPAAYFIDIKKQEAKKVGPLCDNHTSFPSPYGDYAARLCAPQDEVDPAIELMHFPDSLGFPLTVSREGFRVGSRQIHWGEADWFMADIGPEGEPCQLLIEQQRIRCSPSVGPDQVRGVSPGGDWIISLSLEPRSSFIRRVYPSGCLWDVSECRPTIAVDDVATHLEWSPDASKLAVLSGSGLGSDEVSLGYYEVDDWSLRQLAQFEGDYQFTGWCPNSDCFLVEPTKPTDRPSILIYLDGNFTEIPVASPIGFIEIS